MTCRRTTPQIWESSPTDTGMLGQSGFSGWSSKQFWVCNRLFMRNSALREAITTFLLGFFYKRFTISKSPSWIPATTIESPLARTLLGPGLCTVWVKGAVVIILSLTRKARNDHRLKRRRLILFREKYLYGEMKVSGSRFMCMVFTLITWSAVSVRSLSQDDLPLFSSNPAVHKHTPKTYDSPAS